LDLIVHDEFGVFVENGVLALSERGERLKLAVRVKVRGRGLMQTVGLLDHLAHVHCVPVVEEILPTKKMLLNLKKRKIQKLYKCTT
jgi:hypothetical protein